ncbi:hypothetical protein [Emticicia aquatilis]|nr:hypothetical protein [Emticicia aquatilis]
MKKFFSVIALLLMVVFASIAQSVTISAGGSGNVQLPTLSNAQITNFTNPQVGMMVFDKTYNVVRVYNGTNWVCLTCTEQTFNTAQIANIKSFTLSMGTNNSYTASGMRDFKAADNAIGDVKTSLGGSSPNGFLLDNQEVIVFENTLSSTMQNLTTQEILRLVSQSQWSNPSIYNQPIDVVVRSDDANYIYLSREAGSFERREGSILGVKAFRFTNKIFTEKYASFITVTDRIIKNTTSINLLSGMSITNAESYNIISSSQWFVITNGVLTFPTGTNKPQHNYGIIYFLPKSSNLPTYRMRIFTHKASANTIAQYFDSNGNVINRTNYLDSYFTNVISSNVPFVLYLAGGTNLRSINAVRVPPPTAGTEE